MKVSEEIQHYKLSDRPNWWAVRMFKVLSLLIVAFVAIVVLGSLAYSLIEVFDVMALSGTPNASAMFMHVLGGAAWASLNALFYAAIFWVFSLALDKLDQLVWLNASNADRSEILQKRKKKNAKI